VPKADFLPKFAACECRRNGTWPRKAHGNASADIALDTHSKTAVTSPDVSRVGVLNSLMVALPRGNSPSAVAEGKQYGELTGLYEVKRSEGRTWKADARS
jgi:hypothetical protein